jgi:serine/threonine protein kinase
MSINKRNIKIINNEVTKVLKYSSIDRADAYKRIYNTINCKGKYCLTNLLLTEKSFRVFVTYPCAAGNDLDYYFENGIFISNMPGVFLQIAMAIDSLHANNIAHGDIKLSNILYDEQTNKITLIDFDDAVELNVQNHWIKRMDPYNHYFKLQSGTPFFMAPEMLLNISKDLKSMLGNLKAIDMWAIGVCFYMLYTLTRPFPAREFKELVINTTTKQPPPISDPFYNKLILGLLEKIPRKRADSTMVLHLCQDYILNSLFHLNYIV